MFELFEQFDLNNQFDSEISPQYGDSIGASNDSLIFNNESASGDVNVYSDTFASPDSIDSSLSPIAQPETNPYDLDANDHDILNASNHDGNDFINALDDAKIPTPFDFEPTATQAEDDYQSAIEPSALYDETPFFHSIEPNSTDEIDAFSDFTNSQESVDMAESSGPETLGDWFSDLWNLFTDPIQAVQPVDSLVDHDQFRQMADGSEFDEKNGLVVEGNVHQDIDFLSQQTHSSCSLMAQEQFVARYYGESVSESMLEKLMSSYGVYDPEGGTIYEGQTMVLDTFNIPYERNSFASMDNLVNELNSNHDCIIGVDARDFYNDPCIPPGSGHAVTVVGKGIDPASNEIKGFYITDSNYPGSAHFVDVAKLSKVWYNDVISIPNPA